MRKGVAKAVESVSLGTEHSPAQQARPASESLLPAEEQASQPHNECNMHTTEQSTELPQPQLHSMTGSAQHEAQESKLGSNLQSGSSPVHGAAGSDSANHVQSCSWQPAAEPSSLQQQTQQDAHKGSGLHTWCSLADASVDTPARSLHGTVWVSHSSLQRGQPCKAHTHALAAARAEHKAAKLSPVSLQTSVRRSLRLQQS